MNSISFGKTTITSYPEYFEIADNKKTNKLLYLSASLVFIAIYLFDLYQNDFDFGKVSHFKTISAVLWLVIFALQFWLINTESKIEKSKIKEVVVRKNRWTSIVIHYGDKKRKIDGFSQKNADIKRVHNDRDQLKSQRYESRGHRCDQPISR